MSPASPTGDAAHPAPACETMSLTSNRSSIARLADQHAAAGRSRPGAGAASAPRSCRRTSGRRRPRASRRALGKSLITGRAEGRSEGRSDDYFGCSNSYCERRRRLTMPSRRPSFDDREMAEVAARTSSSPRPRSRVSGSIVIDALGHPLADPRLGGACPLRDCAQEIALGDDPDHPHRVLHDDDGADARRRSSSRPPRRWTPSGRRRGRPLVMTSATVAMRRA